VRGKEKLTAAIYSINGFTKSRELTLGWSMSEGSNTSEELVRGDFSVCSVGRGGSGDFRAGRDTVVTETPMQIPIILLFTVFHTPRSRSKEANASSSSEEAIKITINTTTQKRAWRKQNPQYCNLADFEVDHVVAGTGVSFSYCILSSSSAIPRRIGSMLACSSSLRVFILFGPLLFTCSGAALDLLCHNVTSECYIIGQNLTLDEPVSVNVTYSITLIDSELRERVCFVPYLCSDSSIDITTQGNITLINSTVSAALIDLSASYLTVDASSVITVSGRGPYSTTAISSDGVGGTGGGHGGTGADVYLCRDLAPLPNPPTSGLGFGFSALDAPYDFGGSSASIQYSLHDKIEYARGGGILWLEASNTVTIVGTLSADGAYGPSVSDDSACKCPQRPCACGPGGGGGGTIYIGATAIVIVGGGFISAVGGDSGDSGGGGGGIVTFNAPALIGASQVRPALASTQLICFI
jgi:hypothetical protein